MTVGPDDGMPLGACDTDGIALGCDEGSIEVEGKAEGSLVGASDVVGEELG